MSVDKPLVSYSADVNFRPAELVTLPSYMDCHEHEYTQVVIGLNGQAEFEVEGAGSMIGPGQGCIVSSGLDHAFGSLSQRSDILVVNLTKPSADDPISLSKFHELSGSDVYFNLDPRIGQLIQGLVKELESCPEDLYLSRACCNTVIALLLSQPSRFALPAKESRLDLNIIDNYIDQHLGNKISVAQLAGCVYLAGSQFHHLFKEKLGITPHQYVLAKRVEKAKQLMKDSPLSLGQIAELTGFSGQSAFSHSFANLTGMSPSQYRKTHTV
ncbi:AraC family transcriptional regulator [Vibrio sp. S4M6]|uniref:helix-turn-helix domain-containing protein n=1 Tax=Vibrio sinus TaxID=2946865 RepID=UPI00202A84C0|nr:AraC family transcriptional regulator [Vibrio sinus]MCL9781700.1 AraC family transcriptional regulator [Vibrio sinus]